MRIKVMYYSRSGNTRKVADAIAQAVSQPSEQVPPAYPPDNIKLLFLGAGVYAGKIDKRMQEFIRTLTSKRIRNVALFGTSGSDDKGIKAMKDQLESQGINVLNESYQCHGKFFLFLKRRHPTAEDLKNAQVFARKVAEGLAE